MYSIGKFAQLGQIPVKTLRYYDEIGLLQPDHVGSRNGYRYYAAAQFESLNRIVALKNLGLSLREIRELITARAKVSDMHEILRRKRDDLAREIDDQRRRLAQLDRALSGAVAVQDVAVRDVGARLVASLRQRLSTHEEHRFLFDELDRGTRSAGLRAQRGAIWHACRAGAVDCEVLTFLPAPLAANGRVRVRELSAERVASIVYRGDDGYPPAYAAMRAWISGTGAEVAGPKREIFLSAGGDDEESVTQLEVPIRLRGPEAA